MQTQPPTTYLALAPLSLEVSHILNALERLGHSSTTENIGALKVYHIPSLKLSLAQGGHGKTQFGIQAQYLLARMPNILSILCVGSAGSLSESIQPHDIVIGTHSIEHDFKVRFIKKELPRWPASQNLINRFSAANLGSSGNRVHLGPIASGDEDIISKARAEEVKASTGALAVAWEGAGAARAAKLNRVEYIELRAISDSADQSALAHFESHLVRALSNLAEVLHQGLSD